MKLLAYLFWTLTWIIALLVQWGEPTNSMLAGLIGLGIVSLGLLIMRGGDKK